MKRKSNQDRVITEFEESKDLSATKGFISRISSPDFTTMTRKTVFTISLVTAVAVNILLDLL